MSKPPSLHSFAQQRLLEELTEALGALDRQHLRRRLRTVEQVDGVVMRVDGREVVNWCSNDYLGLSMHPEVIDAAVRAAGAWGVGARASRLLAGTTQWHRTLEEALAAWFGVEAALVFPSGYLANLGVMGALLSAEDLIVIDRLAHASLFDAARSTRATLRVFRHHDADHAASFLARAGRARRRLLVTEGVFSMDGDRAPLAALAEVAEGHEALLYVDDAHGAFVVGATGRGTPDAAGVAHERLVYVATLGKALGCQGGFVIGPQALIEFLRSRSRVFLYTTALATPVAAAAAAALACLQAHPEFRETLRQRIERLETAIGGLPGVASSPGAHIIPVILGHAAKAVEVAQQLWEARIWAPAIRSPTVPEGTARLRLSVTSRHTDAHVDALAQALRGVLGR